MRSVILSLVSTLLACFFFGSPWGEALDNLAYDLVFLVRGEIPSRHKIVIVAIDEQAFDEMDMQWPWPRSVHADLVESLKSHGAKTIVFDVLFAEPSSDLGEDQWFAESIAKHNGIVLASELYSFSDSRASLKGVADPTPIVDRVMAVNPDAHVWLGHDAMIPSSVDEYVRSFYLERSGRLALSLSAVSSYLDSGDLPGNISLLGEKEPGGGPWWMSDPGVLWINFLGGRRSINTVSYYQAIEPDVYFQGEVADIFQDALVFVGTATLSEVNILKSSTDHYPVPFSRLGGGVMAGVEIHAQAAHTLLEGNGIGHFSADFNLLMIAVLATFFALAFVSCRPLHSVLLMLSGLVVLTWLSYWGFCYRQVYFSPVATLSALAFSFVTVTLAQYRQAYQQRAFIKGAFSTYLAPDLVEALILHPEQLELGGQEREVTVVFIDLVGFTSLSESFEPKELIAFVNDILGGLAEIILRWDGMIDKYIGDCIMAVWGVPLADDEHAKKAISAMQEISKHVDNLQIDSKAKVKPSVRIGVASGVVVAGNVGGGQQFNYTVLGNVVNLASRLEGANRLYGTRIILNETAKELAGESFSYRRLDSVRVKGQKQATIIYELFDRLGQGNEVSRSYLDAYHSAWQSYACGDWHAAEVGFEQLYKSHDWDRASNVMLERVLQFKDSPPENWDGTFSLLEK